MAEGTTEKARDLTDLALAGELPADPFGGAAIVEERPVLHTVRGILEAAVNDALRPRAGRVVSTGNRALDERTGGLQRGTMTVVGGRTSSGKSTFTLGVINTALLAGKQAMIVSLEDSKELYGKRLLAMRTGIPAKVLRDGEMTAEQQVLVQRCVSASTIDPVFLEARGRSVEWVAEALKTMVRHHRPELVVIDYAQKLATQKRCSGRKEELEHAAHLVSDVCKNLNVAGILVSQLTEENDDQPRARHLRDCKSLGNAAENVLLIWRPTGTVHTRTAGELVEGDVVCCCDKLKDGEPGIVRLHWDTDKACFTEPPSEYETAGFYSGFDGPETSVGGWNG